MCLFLFGFSRFLILHRPDALVEPEEVAKAFRLLKANGLEVNMATDGAVEFKNVARRYEASTTTIATSWFLRYPARMQVISGIINEKRLEEICDASEIILS